MTNKTILQADVLDILFQNRNKDYGAYALRKYYPRRLQWALMISLSLSLLLVIKLRKTGSETRISRPAPGVVVTTAEIPKSRPIEPTQPRRAQPLSQVRHTGIRIVTDDQLKHSIAPTVNELRAALISSINKPGVSSGNSGAIVSGNGDGDTHASQNENGKNFTPSSSEAEFPGGKEAFAKFLTSHIILPEELEAGEKRMVVVRFMVDADGSISKTEIIKTDGEQYSREVIRVLGKMPKWIPAVQNGFKVASWFTQTVSFISAEQ